MHSIAKNLSLLTVSLLLAACGGGGGDGGGVVPTDFTSWSSIEPGSTVLAKGVSTEVVYQLDEMGQLIVFDPTTDAANTSVTMSFDADGNPSLVRVTTPNTIFEADLFGPIFEGAVGALNSDPNSSSLFAIFADPGFFPGAFDYEYQTFGLWESIGDGESLVFGAFSFGAPTAGSAVPTTNSASFVGNFGGNYVNAAGDQFISSGEVNVGVNFVDRSLAFTTSFSEVTQDFDTFTPNEGLNLSGTLIYQPGVNSFSGTVTSVSGMTGTSVGQFYGPSAQELGGVFELQGTGVETYLGSYGAVQVR